MELVSCPHRMRKLINKPTFKYATTYDENLSAVSLQNSIIHFSKLIYIGFAVLEISKELMYHYHYDVMRRHYDSIRLMYMDTDSFVYRIDTEDFYKDLLDNLTLLERMDTSNLPISHPCYVAARKKIPGLFKDETGGVRCTSSSHSGLNSGLMAKSVINTIHENAAAAANIADREFVATPLPSYTPYTPYRKNVSIRSFKHRVKTIKTMKMILNRFDDKRVIDDDRIRTRAYGHYALRAWYYCK